MVVILIQISSDQGFLEPSGAVPADEGLCKYPEPRAVLFTLALPGGCWVKGSSRALVSMTISVGVVVGITDFGFKLCYVLETYKRVTQEGTPMRNGFIPSTHVYAEMNAYWEC